MRFLQCLLAGRIITEYDMLSEYTIDFLSSDIYHHMLYHHFHFIFYVVFSDNELAFSYIVIPLYPLHF